MDVLLRVGPDETGANTFSLVEHATLRHIPPPTFHTQTFLKSIYEHCPIVNEADDHDAVTSTTRLVSAPTCFYDGPASLSLPVLAAAVDKIFGSGSGILLKGELLQAVQSFDVKTASPCPSLQQLDAVLTTRWTLRIHEFLVGKMKEYPAIAAARRSASGTTQLNKLLLDLQEASDAAKVKFLQVLLGELLAWGGYQKSYSDQERKLDLALARLFLDTRDLSLERHRVPPMVKTNTASSKFPAAVAVASRVVSKPLQFAHLQQCSVSLGGVPDDSMCLRLLTSDKPLSKTLLVEASLVTAVLHVLLKGVLHTTANGDRCFYRLDTDQLQGSSVYSSEATLYKRCVRQLRPCVRQLRPKPGLASRVMELCCADIPGYEDWFWRLLWWAAAGVTPKNTVFPGVTGVDSRDNLTSAKQPQILPPGSSSTSQMLVLT
eukprot:g32942.t1